MAEAAPHALILLDGAYAEFGDEDLTAHVLALDPASWRILVGELENAWHALASGRTPLPVREHTSLRQWSRLLSDRAATLDTCGFWERQFDGEDPNIGARRIEQLPVLHQPPFNLAYALIAQRLQHGGQRFAAQVGIGAATQENVACQHILHLRRGGAQLGAPAEHGS